jgi:hypothetical protein
MIFLEQCGSKPYVAEYLGRADHIMTMLMAFLFTMNDKLMVLELISSLARERRSCENARSKTLRGPWESVTSCNEIHKSCDDVCTCHLFLLTVVALTLWTTTVCTVQSPNQAC